MSYSFDLTDSFGGFSTPAAPPDGCTQCGMCMSGCPTYVKSQDPEQSPMGRIRLMRSLEAGDELDSAQQDNLTACLGCYSCETVCPSRVAYGSMLDEALARVREQQPAPRITRMMLWLAARPMIVRALVRRAWLADVLGLRGLASRLGMLKSLGLQRADALLGRVAYPVRLKRRQPAEPHSKVALFRGCFGSALEADVQQAFIDVCNQLGVAVDLPAGQGCCGALHRHNGEPAVAEQLARKNLAAFAGGQADVIVSTSSGCGASLQAYDKWLDGEALPTPVMDVSHYLVGVLQQHKPEFVPLRLKVALHTPCTLRQGESGADQAEAVLSLLQMIPGLEVTPLPTEPRCCGAGGSQMLTEPAMADALRDDVIEAVRMADADVLVSSNLGCAMHLRTGLAEAGIDMPLQHPVQLLAQALAI